jgi:hypothetical protein
MIVFSYFGMLRMLVAVPEYRVTRLYLVTPIMAAMVANQTLLGEYNLSSVRTVLTAAAPSLSGSASVSGAIVPHLEAYRPMLYSNPCPLRLTFLRSDPVD